MKSLHRTGKRVTEMVYDFLINCKTRGEVGENVAYSFVVAAVDAPVIVVDVMLFTFALLLFELVTETNFMFCKAFKFKLLF